MAQLAEKQSSLAKIIARLEELQQHASSRLVSAGRSQKRQGVGDGQGQSAIGSSSWLRVDAARPQFHRWIAEFAQTKGPGIRMPRAGIKRNARFEWNEAKGARATPGPSE